MNNQTNLKPYLLRFASVYLLSLVAVVAAALLLDAFLHIDIGSSGSPAVLVIAVSVVAARFVKEQQREPTRSERRRLTLWSLLIVLAISFVFCAGAVAIISAQGDPRFQQMLHQLLSGAGLGILLGILLVGTLFTAGILWLSWWLFARQQLKVLVKRGEIEG